MDGQLTLRLYQSAGLPRALDKERAKAICYTVNSEERVQSMGRERILEARVQTDGIPWQEQELFREALLGDTRGRNTRGQEVRGGSGCRTWQK